MFSGGGKIRRPTNLFLSIPLGDVVEQAHTGELAWWWWWGAGGEAMTSVFLNASRVCVHGLKVLVAQGN